MISSNLPWHYVFVWIGITTPIFYLALFIFSFANYTLRIQKRIFKITSDDSSENDFWMSENRSYKILYILYIIYCSNIYSNFIKFNTLYRLETLILSFIPCFLFISLKGLYLIDIILLEKERIGN